MATNSTEQIHHCSFCSFLSAARKDLLKHLKDSHVNEQGFFIKCLLCARTFRVFSSFTSNVSRSHPGMAMENAYEINLIIQPHLMAELNQKNKMIPFCL